jgi:chemotaxis protein MotA
MISILGLAIVMGCIVAGYLMEHGNLKVLVQPAELLIIFGSAVGAVIAANPLPVLIRTAKSMLGLLAGSPYNKKCYTEGLRLLYDLFAMARKMGTAKLEADIDAPSTSEVFKKYPAFLKSHHPLDFLCDTLRVAVSGAVEAMDIDTMMEIDIEVHHKEGYEPVAALTAMADALPGLGIVAAVLGIVITMGALGGPKEAIGEKVAAALVGTFAGVLLCYGVFGPLATAMGKLNDAEGAYFGFLRMGALGYVKGLSPIMAVEMARRAIPTTLRPSFTEMEKACRGGGTSAPEVVKEAA